MQRAPKTRSRDRAADIVAALMQQPRTMQELIEHLSEGRDNNLKWEHLRSYVQALQAVGVVRVSEFRGRAKVFALQSKPFGAPDAEECMVKPSAEVLEAKIVEFFSRNPDEELSIDDIAAKFGSDKIAVKAAVYRLANHGTVVIHHVIRRGPDADGGRP